MLKDNRKYLLIIGSVLLFLQPSCANVKLTAVDGCSVSDSILIALQIEKKASVLLSAFNSSYKTGINLDFKELTISWKTKEDILTLFKQVPFKSKDTKINKCIFKTTTGYYVRHIPIVFKRDEKALSDQSINIYFDRKGNIDRVNLTLDAHMVDHILYGDEIVGGSQRREIILKFLEDYQMAYFLKDLSIIRKVMVDSVILTNHDMIVLKSGIAKRVVQNYISNLTEIFRKNMKIDFHIDDVIIENHPKYEYVYGITIKQSYRTDAFNDSGTLFLMIDFLDINNPIIKISDWQPAEYNGKTIAKKRMFGMSDVVLQ